jgi:hypothetical protein
MPASDEPKGRVCEMPAIDRARNYAELRKLVDARRIELRMRMLDVDFDAKLQDGYFAKLMCGTRNFGPVSLGAVLAALGVDICLVPRPNFDAPGGGQMSAAKATREQQAPREWSLRARY